MERMNWHVNLGLFEYRGYVFKYWEAMLREIVLLLRMEWNGFHAMGFVGELPSLGAEDNLGLLRRAIFRRRGASSVDKTILSKNQADLVLRLPLTLTVQLEISPRLPCPRRRGWCDLFIPVS